MTFYEKIGNLKLYFETDCFNECYTTIFAINGSDIVARETFTLAATAATLPAIVSRFMEYRFDTYTVPGLEKYTKDIQQQYGGKLLIVNTAADGRPDYFKQIDDTIYYKHFSTLPAV